MCASRRLFTRNFRKRSLICKIWWLSNLPWPRVWISCCCSTETWKIRFVTLSRCSKSFLLWLAMSQVPPIKQRALQRWKFLPHSCRSKFWARALGIAAASVPLHDLFSLSKKACFTCTVDGLSFSHGGGRVNVFAKNHVRIYYHLLSKNEAGRGRYLSSRRWLRWYRKRYFRITFGMYSMIFTSYNMVEVLSKLIRANSLELL